MFEKDCCYVNIILDLEVLFNVLVYEIDIVKGNVIVDDVFCVISNVYCIIWGVYVVVVMIIGYGMIVFCDLYGIWLLCFGKCEVNG